MSWSVDPRGLRDPLQQESMNLGKLFRRWAENFRKITQSNGHKTKFPSVWRGGLVHSMAAGQGGPDPVLMAAGRMGDRPQATPVTGVCCWFNVTTLLFIFSAHISARIGVFP